MILPRSHICCFYHKLNLCIVGDIAWLQALYISHKKFNKVYKLIAFEIKEFLKSHECLHINVKLNNVKQSIFVLIDQNIKQIHTIYILNTWFYFLLWIKNLDACRFIGSEFVKNRRKDRIAYNITMIIFGCREHCSNNQFVLGCHCLIFKK